MKKLKTIGDMVFCLVLVSPMISFALAAIIGEPEIFGIGGIIRYSWVMWCFIPLGILSIIIGRKLKQEKQSYIKNYIIAFICIPLLMLFGSYRFIFNVVSYDVEKVASVERAIDLDLPNQVKISTIDFDSYNVSYLKTTYETERMKFENEIKKTHCGKRIYVL